MAAVTHDIEIEQGATFTDGFVYHEPVFVDGVLQVDDDGDPIPGPPFDLTGCTARMQIRKNLKSDPLITATSLEYEDDPATGGRIILGGATGRIDIVLTDLDTDALTVTGAIYDLELERPLVDGEIRPFVERVLEGEVTNTLNVTKVDT